MEKRRLTLRSWGWRLGPLALLAGALASPLACTTTVVLPRDPADPVPVFIVDYGLTSVIVVPHAESLRAYAYGDWQYYALANNNVFRGIAALTWPTQGTLGRGQLNGPATASNVLEQARGRGAEGVHVVEVERASVARLAGRIDALYASQRATEVENVDYGMSFVHHPQRYTWFWNSNHQTAAWLEELGCEVRGPAFASRWRIREAER
jgi:hypothetical protein